jgi:hypothetical protein
MDGSVVDGMASSARACGKIEAMRAARLAVRLSRSDRCDICSAMTSARFYFWYYPISKPLAEEGARSI